MKRIGRIFLFLPLLILGICYNSYSQYLQIIKEKAQWHNYINSEITYNFTYIFSGDTIFNGTTYKKLIGPGGTTFLREDTINKTIYHLFGTTEALLYDFKLQVGDTFHYIDPSSDIRSNLKLDSITDTIYSFFVLYKVLEYSIKPKNVFYFHDLNQAVGGNIIWVEGIGSLADLLYSNMIPGEYILLCHYNENGIRDYHSIYDYESQTCEGPIMGIKEYKKGGRMDIYPNPVNEIIYIKLIEPLTGTLNILNNLGQVVKYNIFSEEQNLQVNLSDLTKGIYILKIITKNDMYFEKIIKE